MDDSVKGVIFSGSPLSVLNSEAPTLDIDGFMGKQQIGRASCRERV